MHSLQSLVPGAVRKRPGLFFEALLDLHMDGERDRQLCDELAKVEGKDKCLRRAVFLMAVLLMLSVAGLGYCALLLPEVFCNPDHLLMRSLFVLGLGALISQVGCLGCLLWNRSVVQARLHEECRCRILALAQSKLAPLAAPGPALYVDTESPEAFPRAPSQQAGMIPQDPLSPDGFCSTS